MAETDEITRLLHELGEGRQEALDEVMELVYERLKRLAANRLRARPGSPTLFQPTELVHEAFFKLLQQRNRYDSRGHFFAIANRAMVRVLLDHYRARSRDKRGGDQIRVSLTGVEESGGQDSSMVIPAFVESLERLEQLDPRTAEITQLKVLWGFTVSEIADSLEVSVSTVEREWRFARRWLASRLQDGRTTA